LEGGADEEEGSEGEGVLDQLGTRDKLVSGVESEAVSETRFGILSTAGRGPMRLGSLVFGWLKTALNSVGAIVGIKTRGADLLLCCNSDRYAPAKTPRCGLLQAHGISRHLIGAR